MKQSLIPLLKKSISLIVVLFLTVSSLISSMSIAGEGAKDGSSQLQTTKSIVIPDQSKPNTSTRQSYWSELKQWIRVTQIEITRTLTGYLTKFKETNDYTFALTLIAASFAYGLVHAAGPGHGKIVVSSYVMANNQTMRRGIILAFLSAITQGTVAVALVGILALIFNSTGMAIKQLGHGLTQLSYLLITILGIYLLYSAFRRRLANRPSSKSDTHTHNHEHDENCDCGHSHIPSSHELQGKWDRAKVVSLILSVGLRPCSGAIYILAFALIKDLFWVGVLAVYAMALGTAITISAVTIAVVTGRGLAFWGAKNNSRTGQIISDLFTFGGAIAIITFGIILYTSSLAPVRPF